jgi:XPB/Ssl2-like helicase family protein
LSIVLCLPRRFAGVQTVVALSAHLRALAEDELSGLIRARRDVTIEPVPKTVDQLAERLLHPSSMAAACALLTLPQLQVAEAAAALGDGCTVTRLAGLLGVQEDDPDLAEALGRLTKLVLVWPRPGGLAAAHLHEMWPHPLDLGTRAADLLVTRTLTELRKLVKLYGIASAGLSKDELISALVGRLAQPDKVRVMVAEAPADVQDQLRGLARQPVTGFGRPVVLFGSPPVALPWAVERGLLVRSAWNSNEMPLEVALALRDDVRAPFQPRPPVLSLSPIGPASVQREAAAAASETLAAITAVVEAMSAGPVPLLKTGGLGLRELRRLAKVSGQDEDRTRLTIELLAAGGLTEASQDGLSPSTVYDQFAAAEPAQQLLEVMEDWLTMPSCPLAPPDSTGPAARLLYWDEREELILTGLRALTMRTLLTAVPEGQSTDPAALAARLSWQSPVLTTQDDEDDEDLQRHVTGIWREAHRLGLLAHGSVTTLGRSLFTGDPDDTRRQAEAMLPRPHDRVLLQNDLTAVVPGVPTAGLLTLLDAAATPESRSGAWTWRFSSASVRAALDAGHTPADLITRVTAAAEGGRVPQILTYLIEDVARRHGRVQVRPAGCCLCSDDETLLTEILNTRALKDLGLARLAPTVLVSTKSQPETLTALRAAGYAPAGVRADGSPAIEITPRRRAESGPSDAELEEMFPGPALIDPAELARELSDHTSRGRPIQ